MGRVRPVGRASAPSVAGGRLAAGATEAVILRPCELCGEPATRTTCGPQHSRRHNALRWHVDEDDRASHCAKWWRRNADGDDPSTLRQSRKIGGGQVPASTRVVRGSRAWWPCSAPSTAAGRSSSGSPDALVEQVRDDVATQPV